MHFPPASHDTGYGVRVSSTAIFFRDVYAWMATALAISASVAYLVASSPGMLRLLFGNPVMLFAIAVAPIGVGVYFQRNVAQLSSFAAANLFFGYASLMGALMSSALLLYTGASITRALFISSACYGGAAVFGTVTKRELSQAGQFLMVGLIGVVVASLVNIFLRSPAVEWVTSMAIVVVFAGFTAWDHQSLKRLHGFRGAAGNTALLGAFMLYVNFINLFMAILRVTGQRRDD